jgi:hypothetical protein
MATTKMDNEHKYMEELLKGDPTICPNCRRRTLRGRKLGCRNMVLSRKDKTRPFSNKNTTLVLCCLGDDEWTPETATAEVARQDALKEANGPDPSLVSCFKVGKHLCEPKYLDTMCKMYLDNGPDCPVDLCLWFTDKQCIDVGEVTATQACELIRRIAAEAEAAPKAVRLKYIAVWRLANVGIQDKILEHEAEGVNVFHLEQTRPKNEIKIMLPTDCEWFNQRPENFIEPLIHLEMLEGVTEITFITLDDGVELDMISNLTSWLDSSIADNSFDYHTYFVVNPRFTTPLKIRIPRIQWVKWAVQKKKGQPSTILADFHSLMKVSFDK